MKRTRLTETQIVSIHREAGAGKSMFGVAIREIRETHGAQMVHTATQNRYRALLSGGVN